MALNKQQLEVVNQTNFPDNNSKLITPALLRDFNTDMIDAIQLTGSYASLGSNTFVGNQTITGDLNVTGVISASVLHVQTETASVIYSSGSNQLGDELSDIQTLSGSVKVQGSLTVNGVPVLTSSADVTGFVTTASFNAYTQSTNGRLTSLETNSASVNVSITNLNTTTASLNTSVTGLNLFTQSQQLLNGTFATTGSNTFTGNQIIDRASKLYTNGVYWTDMTAGFNNLEIINQGGGNLDFASLNGGRMRVVNTPLQLTGSTLSSNSDISTSANVYGANLTASAIPAGTISSSAQISALGFVSSSVTASSLITASFSGNTLTFTKGDASTFGVVIPDVSGSTINTGSFATTASFNSYTQSNDQRVNSLEVNSASVNTSITNINSATASLFTSASLALVTASVNNDDITFTKGDGSTFTIQVATGSYAISASYAETASYAQFATDIYLNVKNTTGAQLNKGTVVRIIGATGDNALIQTASWTNDANSANTLGLLYENIANDGFGKAITQGTLLGINTDPTLGYTAGQLLYLSSSGQYTNVKPDAPYHEVRLGQVLRAQQNNGSMYVLIQNGYELDELHDVDINTGSLANNDLLAWDSASQQWTNKTLSEVGATTTSSFNSYTSSTDNRLTNIESTTASLLIETENLELFSASALVSISNLNASSASQQVSINALNAATASYVTETESGSFLITASFSGNTLTFTKGDNSTFGVVIPDVSGSTFDTGSFATTGSNSFNGSQTITGSITTTQDITVSGVRFGFGNPGGTSSIAIGNTNTLQNNTDDNNIAIGNDALQQNTTGERNIGIGTEALKNITGNSSYNTAIGGYALSQATSSTNTFALGYAAMENAQDSTNNIAIGVAALYRKKANSNSNTAIGTNALREHYDGDSNGGGNMAFGYDAMANVTSGSANTAIGSGALRDAGRANENVFIGWISGYNSSGSIGNSVVIGARAGQKLANSSDNTIIGHNAASNLVNGGANTFIGLGAGAAIVTGSQNTLIGSIAGVDNWNGVIAISDGAGAIKTKFQSNIWEFTGSVDIQNTLTASLAQGFTYVGDANGRTTLVATSSFGGGGSIDTGSFATTGSNTFTGNQTINKNGAEYQLIDPSIPQAGTTSIGISGASGGLIFKQSGSTLIEGQAGQTGLTFYGTGSFNRGIALSDSDFVAGATIRYDTTNDVVIIEKDGTFKPSLNIEGTLTASLEQGYVWVGNASGRTVTVATSSFGGGGTINTGSFATTGSNVFTGNQTIQNSDLRMSGSILWPNGLVIGPNGPGQATFITSQTALLLSSSVNSTYTATTLTLTSSNETRINSDTLNTLTAPLNTLTAARTDIRGVETIGDMTGISVGEVYLLGRSGSLILGNSVATPTYAALSHLSSSQVNGNTNLIFKDNTNTGNTIISGSGNIFSNPTAPGAGRINYIGGTSNLFLNGQADNLPQITSSAASVSGNRPVMNGNIINGSQIWTINQAVNPGSHTYAANVLIGPGQWTFNTTGNTGNVSVNNNLGFSSTFLLNSPSRSVAEINAGQSGSNALTISNNSIAGFVTYNGPVSSSTHTITNNNIAGQVTFNLQSGSRALSFTGNIINGTATLNDNTTFIPTLGGTPGGSTISNNNINGQFIANQRASSSLQLSANNINTWTISNDFDASAITNANLRFVGITGNVLFGVGGNNIYASGSQGAVATQRSIGNNILGGSNISASVTGNGTESNLNSTIGVGNDLHIVGTTSRNASNTGGAGATIGSAFFGRYNKLGQGFNTTAEVILAVGTGTSGSAGITRKTGFLIDSGSNSYFEGTLNVSGSTTITGSLILSSSAAVQLQVIGGSEFTGSVGISQTLQLGQLDPLPTGADGQLAVSASNLYFYSGSAWNKIAFG